jgi:hypothetical protein
VRAASDAFARVVASSHTAITAADVLLAGEIVAEGVPIIGGNLTWDRTRQVGEAQGAVQIADPVRLPLSASDVYTPFGYEVRVWRGVIMPGSGLYVTEGGGIVTEGGAPVTWGEWREGSVEVLPIFTGPIQRSSIDGATLLTSVSVQDRSWLVSKARVLVDAAVASGTNYVDLITELLAAGGITDVAFPTSTQTTPGFVLSRGDDRWVQAARLAVILGYELYTDGLGTARFRQIANFSGIPVHTFSEDTNVTSEVYDLDATSAINAVSTEGRNATTSETFTGLAVDDGPASPTYWGTDDSPAAFGHRPMFHYSEFYDDADQAQTGAESMLAQNIGVPASLSLGIVPDPRIEVGDLDQLELPRLQHDQLHIVDTINLDLAPSGKMSCGTRTNRVAA